MSIVKGSAASEFLIGRRFTSTDSTASRREKAARRMLRRRAIRQASSIERAILKARRELLDVRDLSDNSHAARRNVIALREERRGSRI